MNVPDLLHTNGFDLRKLPPEVDLVKAIRQASTADLGCPWSWTVANLDDDRPWYQQPALLVGVRDADTGALAWEDDPFMTPVNGSNTELVDYWLGGLHHTPMERHTEVPIDDVLAAVAEFVRIGRRPECITWESLTVDA